ncbi:conserved membrane protein of unknown function [Nitrospira sp. KM1]|uniref:carotenoid biosynthesis protein n=1 Tax=Nitrospira sp. KM1 TaxID=1936990 RepID=UPI0013A72CEA|nr:carotenoid biosynthesis protein [Nitrospira sp. KM1]BCA55782.1 conserved membrane protein of unknown function [Nitrospira sp. KM1]
MDVFLLFLGTIVFRPYVFVFLAAFLFSAIRLIGWPRTWRFWLVSWITAFICEYSSTRTGIPFGWYHYNGSTVGQELYLSNIPFIDSLSFSFLLYAAYCMALTFLLPITTNREREIGPARITMDLHTRTSWQTLVLTALFFAGIDTVIDPVALRGDRWFLGKIYYYPDPGVHFGVPIANYLGWITVGVLSLLCYFPLDRGLPPQPSSPSMTPRLLLGAGLYYGVLTFNLAVTFWIGETLLAVAGILTFLIPTVLLWLRIFPPLASHRTGGIESDKFV